MSNLERRLAGLGPSGPGWLNCYGCGTLGPYRMVNGHPYCRTCESEGVPIADSKLIRRIAEARLLRGLDPVTGGPLRYTGPTVPVEWGELPAFIRFRWVEGNPRAEVAWHASGDPSGIGERDWSELQDPRD